MFRVCPVLIGLGLAVLWTIATSVDATTWLTWGDGGAAGLVVATVGLIPERKGSLLAAGCLAGVSAGLFALWIVGLMHDATPWLTWWTFVAAGMTATVAVAVSVQGHIDGWRTREYI